MSLMHMKKRYRLDSEGTFNSSLDSTPPVSDVEEDDLQKLKVTPFNKVGSRTFLFPISNGSFAKYVLLNIDLSC